MKGGDESMRLWLLRPHLDVLARPVNPWTPPWDKTFAVLVRAKVEDDARRLAHSKAGNEGMGIYGRLGVSEDESASAVWLDPEWTACDELLPDGEPGAILVVREAG